MRKVILSVLTIITSTLLFAQQHQSIHQEELEYYNSLGITDDSKWDSLFQYKPVSVMKATDACPLDKIVFGWNPYWQASQYNNFQWEQLSDLCWFSYEVNASTGNATSTHSWATTPVVAAAQNNGKRVHLCVTLFSSHATFFANPTAQTTLVNNLIAALQQRNAIGINIDFEGVPSSQKANLTAFMKNLSESVHNAIPGSIISVCLPSVDWSPGSWDVNAMCTDPVAVRNVDWFIIMGYDYYYGGSSQAGPTDPLYALTTGYNYCHTKSITYYLSNGVPKSKLILGLPYYGKEWRTASNSVPSATLATGSSITYKTVRDNPGTYSAANKHWNNTSYTPYYTFYPDTSWKQCWIIDQYAYGKRLEMVNNRGIAGIGIWALGYDDGYTELWDMLKEKFTSCGTVVCSDTIYDMGGPDRNYYDKENYSCTIAPTGASAVSLNFSSFNVETDYDTLWLYDGSTTTSPLIGSYTGTNSPGTVTSTGNAITLKFKSDNSTTATGWKAVWQCLSDNTAPSTSVSTTGGTWKTTDFTANFTDADNTGVEKSYYQVIDFDGSNWGANTDHGFFADNFDNTAQWATFNGTWNSLNGNLHQADSTVGNTNIFAPLNQDLSNRYLYHFTARVESSPYGTNQRRFGLHFHCDTGNVAQRGNSYFIFFRQETSKLEFYKVTNSNPVQTKVVDNVVTNIGQWYDLKIIFDRVTGKISVYRDNVFISSWTDTAPLTTPGNYVSFRTGNCKASFGELKVFRSRTAGVSVTIGSPGSDIRFQNPDAATHAAKIKSVVNDAAGNLSAISYYDLDVDWTPPSDIQAVYDGLSSDIDTAYVTSELSANWPAASDQHSGITHYWYAIGTTSGATDIQDWTDNGTNLYCNASGLTLGYDQLYFISVKVQNGAGLYSGVSISDGVVIRSPTAPPQAGFSYSSTVVCIGVPVSFVNESSNADSFSWHLTGPEIFSSAEMNPQFPVTASGSYQVQLICNGPGGSDSVSQNITITVHPLPPADAGNNISACEGDSVSLSASGGINYQWNNGITNGIPFVPLTTTIYTVTVTDDNNCISYDSTEVAVYPLPLAYAGADQTVCSGDSVTLTASGGSVYTWDNSVLNGTSFLPVQSGIYTVTVTNTYNCSAISSLTLHVSQPPQASFTVNTTSGEAPLTVLFSNTSVNASGYRWYFGDSAVSLGTNPYHIYQDTGLYTVTLIAINPPCENDTFLLAGQVHVSGATLIKENSGFISGIDIFPNPARGYFNISVNLQQAGLLSIVSENVLGKQVKIIFNDEAPSGIFVHKSETCAETSRGIYFIKVYFNNELKGIQRLIIQ